MGEAHPGRAVAITGDTAPCKATAEAAHGAELLVHDASFAEEEAQRAADTGHSTAGQAAAELVRNGTRERHERDPSTHK